MTDTVRVQEQAGPPTPADLCGRRLAVVTGIAAPRPVPVHRTAAYGGQELSCPPERGRELDAAAVAHLDTLSRALERLYRAHGGNTVDIDLAAGRRTWSPLGPWPWWMRRSGPELSADAQRVFAAEAATSWERYRPTSAEISALIGQARQEQAAEADRRTEVMARIARQRCWTVRRVEGAALVRRIDLPGAAPGDQGPFTAYELDAELRRTVPEWMSGPGWEDASRAAVERDLRSAGVPVAFHVWWSAVSAGHWSAHRLWHARRQYPVTSHPRGYGSDIGASW